MFPSGTLARQHKLTTNTALGGTMKFTFTRQFSGYSRGTDTVTVEADSEEEAIEAVEYMDEDDREVVRDDTKVDEWELD